MGIADSMKKAAFSTAFSYIGKNPEENAPKLMAWVDKFAGDGPNSFPTQRAAVRKAQLSIAAQVDGLLTLNCDGKKPTVDIPAVVVILG